MQDADCVAIGDADDLAGEVLREQGGGDGSGAAEIADDPVTPIIGAGTEKQWRFQGVLASQKPFRDWMVEILACALGYFTFEFGKLKLGCRINATPLEPFTLGNILFQSLRFGAGGGVVRASGHRLRGSGVPISGQHRRVHGQEHAAYYPLDFRRGFQYRAGSEVMRAWKEVAHAMCPKGLSIVLPLLSFLVPFRAPAQAPQLIGVLDTTDYLSYTGFQPDIHLSSPCGQSAFSGGVAGVFTGSKTQGGNTLTASVDYLTRGLGNGVPMTAYNTGSLAIYALAPPNTPITLTGKRTGSTMVTSSGATVSASAPTGQHTSFLPGGPSSVAINDNLFTNGAFVTGAASGACPGYSYVTSVDLSTYLIVNNNCPGTTCGTAEAVVNITVQSGSNKPTITTSSIPTATYNLPYTFTFQASGGTQPYTWTVQGDPGNGPLNYFPPGFQFSSAGTIGVDPSSKVVAGAYNILVTVTDHNQQSDSKAFTMNVTCGDAQRDQLTAEYLQFGAIDLTFTLDNPPACADFTQTAHSVYFSFSNINKPAPSTAPLYSWALIRYPLTVPALGGATFGLDTWVTLLGAPAYQGIINSGYRSPSQNAAAGGVGSSRHMWGDAVDLQNLVHPSGTRKSCNPQYPNPPIVITACYAEYQRMVQAAGFALASYVEKPDLGCAYNCVHADWRNSPGDFQQ